MGPLYSEESWGIHCTTVVCIHIYIYIYVYIYMYIYIYTYYIYIYSGKIRAYIPTTE